MFIYTLQSYDPVANAVYAPAMRALEAARLKIEMAELNKRRAAATNGANTDPRHAAAPRRQVHGAAAQAPQWTYAPPSGHIPGHGAPMGYGQQYPPAYPAYSGPGYGAPHGPTQFYPPSNAQFYSEYGTTVAGGMAPLPAAAFSMPGMEWAGGAETSRSMTGMGTDSPRAGSSASALPEVDSPRTVDQANLVANDAGESPSVVLFVCQIPTQASWMRDYSLLSCVCILQPS